MVNGSGRAKHRAHATQVLKGGIVAFTMNNLRVRRLALEPYPSYALARE